MALTPEQARREIARRKALKAAQQAPAVEAPAPAAPAEEFNALERFGRWHREAGKALLTGAGVSVAQGKDDDLAGTAGALGASVQKDLDKDEPMSGLRRVLGTAMPLLVPGMGIPGMAISKFEQMRSDDAAPGVREEATQGRRDEVAQSFKDSPALTTAGMIGGGLLTGGASAAQSIKGAAPTAAQRALAALPSGAVTGYESNDAGNTQERLMSGLLGGGLAAGGAAVIPPVLGAVGRGLDRVGSATLRPKHVAPSAWQQVDKALAAYDDVPGLVKAGANAKTGGVPAIVAKGAKVLRQRFGPTPKARANITDAAAYAAKPSADDLLMQKMTGGADLVDDLAASADDVAEEAPVVLRKRIIPVGPEDIVDDVAPRAAPVPENTPTPRPMTPAEMEAAISRLPSRGKPPSPSPLDAEVEAMGAGLRAGKPVPLEGADVDPFVAPRDPTAVGRKTPRPAPLPGPEVMPDDFVDEGVSVLRQLPGRRAAPQLEAAPETLQLEGRGDVPALPARPAQRQLEAPAPVLRKRTPDKPRKLFGPPSTYQGIATMTPEEQAAGLAEFLRKNSMAPVEPARMPLLPPDLLEAQLARTGGDREKALAAAHGQLSREFKRTDPELARGRQRSAVKFDDASPGPAPIATPKGRNRSAAPFQGEDWAPREQAPKAAVDRTTEAIARARARAANMGTHETSAQYKAEMQKIADDAEVLWEAGDKAGANRLRESITPIQNEMYKDLSEKIAAEAPAPAAVVDDVAAPVADRYALSSAAEKAATKAQISGTQRDMLAAAKAHEDAAAAHGGANGYARKHQAEAADLRQRASSAPTTKIDHFDASGSAVLRPKKKATPAPKAAEPVAADDDFWDGKRWRPASEYDEWVAEGPKTSLGANLAYNASAKGKRR